MSDCVFLGFAIPDAQAEALFALDPSPAVQTHKFGWSLVRALRHGMGGVRLLSSSPVQSYPVVPRLWFGNYRFTHDAIEGRHIGFVNLVLVKHLMRFFGCLARPFWLRGCRVVVIHGVHSPYLVFGLLLRLGGKTVIPVLTDPAGVVLGTDGGILKRLKSLDKRIVRAMLRQFSGVVALAPDLLRDLPASMPRLVFPGIVSRDWLEAVAAGVPLKQPGFSVLYAGGLNRRYGAEALLEAARLLPHVQFHFFGRGDHGDAIAACGLPNVTAHGFVGQAALVPHLLAADVLINPRPTSEAFAAESFPSKLIEYLAAGRPVLTTRMKAIPTALQQAFHYIDDETPQGIASAIAALAAIDPATRATDAMRARDTVLAQYGEAAIGAQIAELVDRCQGVKIT